MTEQPVPEEPDFSAFPSAPEIPGKDSIPIPGVLPPGMEPGVVPYELPPVEPEPEVTE